MISMQQHVVGSCFTTPSPISLAAQYDAKLFRICQPIQELLLPLLTGNADAQAVAAQW